MKLNPEKLEVLGLLYGGNCSIRATTAFDCSTHVIDGYTYRQTDAQTDGIAILYTCYSYAVARKNTYTTPIHNAYSRKNKPAERINERETVRYRHADVLRLSGLSKQGIFPFALA